MIDICAFNFEFLDFEFAEELWKTFSLWISNELEIIFAQVYGRVINRLKSFY